MHCESSPDLRHFDLNGDGRYLDTSSRLTYVVLLLILIDREATSYQLLNLSLEDLFLDKPFRIAALLSFELSALASSDLDTVSSR
jgi:hypothetical protein